MGNRIHRTNLATGRLEAVSGSELASGDRWNGIKLEGFRSDRSEIGEGFFSRHLIGVFRNAPITSEGYWSEAKSRPWSRRIEPGVMHVFPARMPYAVRCDGVAEGLLIELAPEMLESIARAHAHGRTELRPAICVRDPLVVHLAHALESDLRAGVPVGRTYGESI